MKTKSTTYCKRFDNIANLQCIDDDTRSYWSVCSMSLNSFSLAVIVIIRLFGTSAFRVPNASKVIDWCTTIMVSRDLSRLRTSHVIMHCGNELAVNACMGAKIRLLCIYTKGIQLLRTPAWRVQCLWTQQNQMMQYTTETLHDLKASIATTPCN